MAWIESSPKSAPKLEVKNTSNEYISMLSTRPKLSDPSDTLSAVSKPSRDRTIGGRVQKQKKSAGKEYSRSDMSELLDEIIDAECAKIVNRVLGAAIKYVVTEKSAGNEKKAWMPIPTQTNLNGKHLEMTNGTMNVESKRRVESDYGNIPAITKLGITKDTDKPSQDPEKVKVSHSSDPTPSAWKVNVGKTYSSQGFFNPGVMCYRNSLLQALLHVPLFVNWLLLHHGGCTNGSRCVACWLKVTCQEYWSRSPDGGKLNKSINGMQRLLKGTDAFKNTMFDWRRQQDAPEFYGHVVNAILETNQSVTRIVKSIFGYSLAIRMTCGKCGDVTRVETTQNEDFVLNIKYQRAAPLQQLLQQYTFGQSTVEGRRCDACRQVSDNVRTERILRAPQVLVIQLCRFKETRHGRTAKDERSISFPEQLDVSPFSERRQDLRYSLLAVVQHMGDRQSGHYRTVAKGPEGKWEEMDDSRVRRSNAEAALDPRKPWTPYMIMYGRM